MTADKIHSLEQLAEIADGYRRDGKRVVLCHGMFDLVHLGHIRHLTEAKSQGDVLMVTTTGDTYSRKGPGRPVFPENLRVENLAALQVVDHVAISYHPTAIESIEAVRPDVYAKGIEYKVQEDDLTGMIATEREAIEACNGRIYFTDDITFSSSALLNEHFDALPPTTREYLRALGARSPALDIIRELDKSTGLKVLVVGDSIIDRYTYTSPLGQSGKGIHFVVRYHDSEDHAGGSVAVANHIGSFVDDVTLFTGLGGKNSEKTDYEAFIKDNLHENVSPLFYRFDSAQTLVKERFVDRELNKYFEVYTYEEEPQVGEEEEERVCRWLTENLSRFDVVVVPDYGNGFITDKMVEILCAHARFLAVNTQINSGNRGYHVVNRYRRANFISLNEPELRLATHNRHDSIELLAEQTADRLGAAYISVTCGPRGLIGLDRKQGEVFHVPALASQVVDRVGAGDAFLSLSAICLGVGMGAGVSAFVGAVAAALDVQIVGNKTTIDKVDLQKYMTALLK